MNNFAVINHKNPVFDKCPSCRTTGTLHRSRARNLKENIVKKLTFYSLYRCKSCGWRGYRSKVVFTSRSFIHLFYYGLIVLGVAMVVWFVLTRSEWTL